MQKQNTHHWLVGTPVIIAAVFCFGFLMTTPQTGQEAPPVSNQADTRNTITHQPLPPASFTPTQQLPLIANSAAGTEAQTNISQAQTQSPNSSTTNLQAAVANNNQSGSTSANNSIPASQKNTPSTSSLSNAIKSVTGSVNKSLQFGD